jgi:hypothetical protein
VDLVRLTFKGAVLGMGITFASAFAVSRINS